ncbi:MAG: prolyl oligopeptidase family serine peptidase [Vicinamibacterales bacterium]
MPAPRVWLVLSAIALVSAAPEAQTARFALTVDSIMRGPELVGYPPTDLRWSGDSSRLYFEWRLGADLETSTWVVDAAGGTPARLSDADRKAAQPVDAVWDEERRRALAVQDGDIVLIDTVARSRRVLVRTVGAEANPRWIRHDTHVTFTRENNLYLIAISGDGSGLTQLTDIGPKKSEPTLTESQKFLKGEERTLLGVVERKAKQREKKEADRKAEELPRLELTDGQTVPDIVLSPDERHAYLLVADKASNAKTTQVPNYVTESAYTEEIASRIKVGDAQARRRLAILDLQERKTRWADLPGAGTPAPTTGSSRESGPSPSTGAGPQTVPEPAAAPPVVVWGLPRFSADGRAAIVAARSGDNKDGYLLSVDPATGATRLLDHQHDDAWVRWSVGGGPFGGGSFGWLPDNRRAWFLSERDGWMHLYTVDVTDTHASPTQLTTGRWEITDVDLSPDRSQFLLTTTEEHPGERHLYEMALDGGARRKLTTRTGAHQVVLSPDGRRMATISSASNLPPEVYLMDHRAGADMVRVTTSTSEEWRAYKWIEPQLVTYSARDGVEVYARLFTPEMVGAKRQPNAPAVVFVHGAGYAQNAHRYWSSYFREYMFHHLLASRGYVVLDPDYRASAGYGRDWRTAIYRHMGGKDLEDVIDGVGYLTRTQHVDPKRVGVYGGSYGGFITLMAMFTTPDVFAAGAALRPVTDWAHYNHPYTANILNEPQLDADAYRRSSPIYFAERLKGALLICHGMVDTNVHFQDSVRLVQRLIELRKENWEFAPYPVEDHGFLEPTSWADEYRRILKLFEEHVASTRTRR